MSNSVTDTVRTAVRERYAEVARGGAGCCSPGCCAPITSGPSKGPEPPAESSGRQSRPSLTRSASEVAMRLGYSAEDLAAVPDGANLGLGCGNPQTIARLRPGERVLDLGSGAGFDCLLAARQVGPEGRVIGVDMTPEMLSRARANAAKAGLTNVDFRLGEIEHLPVPDQTIDVILSNCVINLSPDKAAVFGEAFRVLRAGGRLAIHDVVALAPLSEAARRDVALLTGCVSGAAVIADLKAMLAEAGFVDVRVDMDSRAGVVIGDLVASASIEARRP